MRKRFERGLRSVRLRGLRSLGQPDVWLQNATKENGFEYHEMLFVYARTYSPLSPRRSLRMKKAKGVSNRRILLGVTISTVELPDDRDRSLRENDDGYVLNYNVTLPFPNRLYSAVDVTDERLRHF